MAEEAALAASEEEDFLSRPRKNSKKLLRIKDVCFVYTGSLDKMRKFTHLL